MSFIYAWPKMLGNSIRQHASSYKQRFFSTQPQCCLTFSWTELQMLLRCCLIHISIIILRCFTYLLYLCLCLHLGLFMLYLCESIFIFLFIFIMINCISHECRHACCLAYFLEYVLLLLDDNVDEECKQFLHVKSLASGCCLAFAWLFANFSLALLIKKACSEAYCRKASLMLRVSHNTSIQIKLFILLLRKIVKK